MRTEQIGRLVSFSGTVTRTSDVRPELLEGKFRCLQCGTISESIQQQFKYTEPKICSNPACGNRTLWQLIMEQSRFADYQRIHVQENTGEIPSGSMPRFTILLYEERCLKNNGSVLNCCSTFFFFFFLFSFLSPFFFLRLFRLKFFFFFFLFRIILVENLVVIIRRCTWCVCFTMMMILCGRLFCDLN